MTSSVLIEESMFIQIWKCVGLPGATGSQGIQGATGPTGLLGQPGDTGGSGPPGATGATGLPGAGMIGATGLAGSRGLPGSPGSPGQAGPAGCFLYFCLSYYMYTVSQKLSTVSVTLSNLNRFSNFLLLKSVRNLQQNPSTLPISP